MSRPRGNRSSEAKIEERRARAVKLMNEGKKQGEVADQLRVSRSTLWRDLAKLRERFTEENSEAFTEYRKAQLRCSKG